MVCFCFCFRFKVRVKEGLIKKKENWNPLIKQLCMNCKTNFQKLILLMAYVFRSWWTSCFSWSHIYNVLNYFYFKANFLLQELNEGKFRLESSVRDLRNKVALLEEVNRQPSRWRARIIFQRNSRAPLNINNGRYSKELLKRATSSQERAKSEPRAAE